MSPESDAAAPSPALSRAERRFLWLLFAVALAARLWYAFIFRVDSDEPQHLHVVWAWAHGLIPYRDIFDNHAPLFHILCAPVFRLLPERADILLWMRTGMTLFAALCAWGVYRLGREFYSARAGAWAALLAMLEPHFFYTSTEFRADDLWAAAWLLFLVALAASRGRRAWLFLAGLLLGATFAASLKTSLLTISLLCACAVTAGILLATRAFHARSLANWRGALAFLAGLIVIPGLLVLFFWHEHALVQARYCLVEHNIVPGLKRWGNLRFHTIVFCIAAPLLVAAAALLHRFTRGEARVRFWRAMLFLVPGFYYALLWCFWPDVTREDNMPFSPLVMLNAAPALLALGPKLRLPNARWLLPAGAALVELYLVFSATKPWHDDAARNVADYAIVLRLTGPDDYVMDQKSGAIYRRRPFYYVLETITRARMKLHLIKEDIARHLIDTRTAVIDPHGITRHMESRTFVVKNYLPLASPAYNIWVLGQDLGDGQAAREFTVAIPADYVFIRPDGTPVPGTLDGRSVDGAASISPGPHSFVPANPAPGLHIVLFWARALNQGYAPSLSRWSDFANSGAEQD